MKRLFSLLIICSFLAIIIFSCENEPEPEPLPKLTVSASQSTIEYGQTATITWSALNATTCSTDAGTITGTSGSIETWPLFQTTTYTFTAKGPGGIVTATITIKVNAAPIPILKVSPERDTIIKGETVNLLIESSNATEVEIKLITDSRAIDGILYSVYEKKFDALNGTYTSIPLYGSTRIYITAKGIDSTTKIDSSLIFIPTRTDTLCGRYWIMKTMMYYFEGEWIEAFKNDEDLHTRKLYYYLNGFCEVFKKDNSLVGNGYWKWIGQDSIKIGSPTYEYQLTDTTFIRSERNGTSIETYIGYKIN